MPRLGSGILVGSYGPFNAMSAVYLATYVASAPATPPTAKLGNTTSEPPSATWTKLGLLQDDAFTVSTTQARFVEDRRGFKKVLYARALNQAGNATFDGMVVETDPLSIANVTGQVTTAIGSNGERFQITYDQLYDRTLLIYSINAYDGSERYIWAPHCQVTYELQDQKGQNWLLKVTADALQYAPQTGVYAGADFNYEMGRFN